MKTITYITLFFVASLFSSTKLYAQTTYYHYRFSYDDSGNREKRIYIQPVLKKANINNISTKNKEEFIVDNTKFGEVKIYPSPTKGNLTVEISHIEAQKVILLVYNLQGKQLLNKTLSISQRTSVDLSRFPAGMYIMKIIADKQSSQWKIIKE